MYIYRAGRYISCYMHEEHKIQGARLALDPTPLDLALELTRLHPWFLNPSISTPKPTHLHP